MPTYANTIRILYITPPHCTYSMDLIAPYSMNVKQVGLYILYKTV